LPCAYCFRQPPAARGYTKKNYFLCNRFLKRVVLNINNNFKTVKKQIMINDNDMNIQGILGVMVPIVAIVGGISYATINRYLRSKERMEMISRGIDVSKFDNDYDNNPWKGRPRRSNLSSGLSLMGIGVGVLLAFIILNTVLTDQNYHGHRFVIYLGCVFFFWGLARILAHVLEPKDTPKQ
jgi:hypothetical protein